MSITLNSNDRVFITGKTGSGKTYLARYLTESLPRLVVLDGKGSLASWNLEDWHTGKYKLSGSAPVRLRARVPVDVKKMPEFWNDVLMKCLRAGNVVIYIDELYTVVPPNTSQSAELFAVYTRGRESGVGVWASTQRPVWIPLVAISESEHFFVFRLQLEEDKKRLAAFMGVDVMESIPDQYGFFYMVNTADYPDYYSKLDAARITQTKVDTPRRKSGIIVKRR